VGKPFSCRIGDEIPLQGRDAAEKFCAPHPQAQTQKPMRYFVPLLALTLVACLLPQNNFALAAYLGIGLYSIMVTVGLFRKAPPQMQRQTLIAASCAVGVALVVGIFFYLR
jgi:hypothetical protein